MINPLPLPKLYHWSHQCELSIIICKYIFLLNRNNNFYNIDYIDRVGDNHFNIFKVLKNQNQISKTGKEYVLDISLGVHIICS